MYRCKEGINVDSYRSKNGNIPQSEGVVVALCVGALALGARLAPLALEHLLVAHAPELLLLLPAIARGARLAGPVLHCLGLHDDGAGCRARLETCQVDAERGQLGAETSELASGVRHRKGREGSLKRWSEGGAVGYSSVK